MKIYTVVNNDTDYREEFHSLTEVKKAMKANNAKGFITKVWRNGDWKNCGEITLNGQNKTFIANTKQQKKNY